MDSYCIAIFLFVVASVDASYRPPHYHTPPYTVELDTVTFDKVVSHVNVTLVLFKKTHEYGYAHREFGRFAEATETQSQVTAAVVVIDDAELSNMALGDRFGITLEQMPVMKLFSKGRIIADSAVTDSEEMRAFVMRHTGLWLGRPGTVQYLDSLVDEFMTKKTGGEQNIILDKAREFRDVNATEDELMKSSLYYIKLFEEYIYRGPGFMGMESGRLKMLASRNKVNPPAIRGIRKEQNILKTFQDLSPQTGHDEL